MKTIIYFFLFSFSLWAQEISPHVKCLAEEEERYFRAKEKGPHVILNNEMLFLLTSIKELELQKAYLQEVCSKRNSKRALSLLKLILIQGPHAFYSTAKDPIYKEFQKNFLEDLKQRSSEFFFDYLSRIQSSLPKADCLRDEIPQFKLIQDNVKLLRTDMDIRELMPAMDLLAIFKALKNIDQMSAKCEKKHLVEMEKLRNPPSEKE